MSPASAPQMQFNQKETASNKLFQYPEQSDKQGDSERKYKAPRERVRLLIMANSSARAKKFRADAA